MATKIIVTLTGEWTAKEGSDTADECPGRESDAREEAMGRGQGAQLNCVDVVGLT
jgi:hypothetical protein